MNTLYQKMKEEFALQAMKLILGIFDLDLWLQSYRNELELLL